MPVCIACVCACMHVCVCVKSHWKSLSEQPWCAQTCLYITTYIFHVFVQCPRRNHTGGPASSPGTSTPDSSSEAAGARRPSEDHSPSIREPVKLARPHGPRHGVGGFCLPVGRGVLEVHEALWWTRVVEAGVAVAVVGQSHVDVDVDARPLACGGWCGWMLPPKQM